MPADTVVCGEVGLAGEVRAAGNMELRLREAERLGFSRFVMPKSNSGRLNSQASIQLAGVATIQEVLELLFD